MINYKAQPDSPPANQQVSPQPPAIQQTNPELAEDNPSSSSQQEFWRRKTCFQDGWATPEKFDGCMQAETAGPCPHSPPVKAAPHPQGGHHLNPHHLSVIPHMRHVRQRYFSKHVLSNHCLQPLQLWTRLCWCHLHPKWRRCHLGPQNNSHHR